MDQSVDGTDPYPGSGNQNFRYDTVGRLTEAWVPGQHLTYSYAANTCGVADAGRNGNRTSMTVNATTTTYC